MIVGLTVAYLVVRTSTSGPVGGGAATSESVTTGPASSGTTEPEETTTSEATEARCWSPEHERTSSNPSVRLRGGGLQFIPPSGFDICSTDTLVYLLNYTNIAHSSV